VSAPGGLPPSLTRAGRGRLAPAEGGLRATQSAVLRAFATTGRAPAPEALAVPGVDVGPALACLHAEDFLRLDGAGRIVAAYPFSAAPTAYLVHVDGGPSVHAMCAIDALGIARLLGRATSVRSADPSTGEPVRVELDAAGRLRDHKPPAAAVLVAATAHGDSCIAADTCCASVSFFASGATAQDWLDANPDVRGPVIDLVAALDLANEVFGHLLA
jgi:hypothetical protein